MVILINNYWAEQHEAKIDLFSDAVMFGYGLFETFKTQVGGHIFRLDDHINRLLGSAVQIGLRVNYSAEQIGNMVERVADRSDGDIQRLKILAFNDLLIVTSVLLIPDDSIYKGVSLKSVSQQRALPEFKSTSYLDCLRSYQIASKEGYQDALLIDDDGYVTEGSRCNVFWVQEGAVMTRRERVLPGITRKVIIENMSLDVIFSKISLKDLPEVDELFMTNSIIGVVPVVKVDNTMINTGDSGPVTHSISDQYHRQTAAGMNGKC